MTILSSATRKTERKLVQNWDLCQAFDAIELAIYTELELT